MMKIIFALIGALTYAYIVGDVSVADMVVALDASADITADFIAAGVVMFNASADAVADVLKSIM